VTPYVNQNGKLGYSLKATGVRAPVVRAWTGRSRRGMSGDSRSIFSFGLYASTDTWVTCHHYADQTPILAIDAGASSLTISVKGHDASDSALTFARELARHAQEFAAEVERIHAAQHPGTAITNGGTAATDKAAGSKAA
jgi:hypothetical protein